MKFAKKNILISFPKKSAFGLLVLLFCLSCSDDIFHVDVSDVALDDVSIQRFDVELQQLADHCNHDDIVGLQRRYPAFFEVYNTQIINIGSSQDSSYATYLRLFLNDYAVAEGYAAVAKIFADTKQLDREITSGFKHLKYYFPDIAQPQIIGFVAGFNQSVVVCDSNIIGIGLDKYLGADCELYAMLEIPAFARQEMSPEQIPLDIMRAWFDSEIPFRPKTENMAESIVYQGIKQVFLDAIFPDIPTARKMIYTPEQLAYCEKYERNMWVNIVENKLLFSPDMLVAKKFVEPAPYTYQFGTDSPGRTGCWIGYKIVLAYMQNNQVPVNELLRETDYQKILNKSGYNPHYK